MNSNSSGESLQLNSFFNAFVDSFDLIASVSLITAKASVAVFENGSLSFDNTKSLDDIISTISFMTNDEVIKNTLNELKNVNVLADKIVIQKEFCIVFESSINLGNYVSVDFMSEGDDCVMIAIKHHFSYAEANIGNEEKLVEEIKLSVLISMDSQNDKTVLISDDIKNYIPLWHETNSVVEHMDMFGKILVHPDDRRMYRKALRTSHIYELVLGHHLSEFSFRAVLNGRTENCKLIFSLTNDPEYPVVMSFVRIFRSVETIIAKDVIKENPNILEGLKILMVDSDILTRQLNSMILTQEGAKVDTAENARQALDMFRAFSGYDAILLDILSPQDEGVEAIKTIRSLGIEGMSVPVIVISSDNDDEQITHCLEYGANEFMSKPLVVTEFSRILLSCMRNESEKMEKRLADTIRIANTDALTHVKNIAAYTDMVSELSEKISKDDSTRFAVVICDINDLKKVNDMYGHDVGDQYIKNCSKIICEVFSHSPVYRIGGDEFAVFIQGPDYFNSEALMSLLDARVKVASMLPSAEEGKASLAAGIAIYDVYSDYSVSDTIKRADMEMYKNKRLMKS